MFGSPRTNIIKAWDYPEWKKDVNNDKKVCVLLSEVLNGADAIVTHNGRGFDYKHFQTRCLLHGLPPLPKIAHIDTKVLAKSNISLVSNSLKNACEVLTDEEKMPNDGWDLWVRSHGGEKKALETMAKYCKQDVVALEALFRVLRPFAKIPNHNLFTVGAENCCPNCGGTRLSGNGYRYTQTSAYKRLRCLDCGTSSRTDCKDRHPRTL